MNLFRSGWNTVVGSQEPAQQPSPSDTIERLVERLQTSTLFEDRRDACRALKSLAKSYRVEVGAQGMDALIHVLEQDKDDKEIISLALDALNFIICGPEDEFTEDSATQSGHSTIAKTDSSSHEVDVGFQFTDIFAKKKENVFSLLGIMEEYDFKVRWPAVKLVLGLLKHRARPIQDSVLQYPTGVSRLMDLLSDSREVVRNDSLLLFIQLTRSNANIQKIVAFENAFDRVLDIISNEGFSDGGVVVHDCLTILLNLLKNNASNLNLFKEGPYVQKLSPFVDFSDETEWSPQKASNTRIFLQVLRALVSPTNPAQVTSSCQKLLNQTGLLSKLSLLMLSNGVPVEILTETINTVSETVRGNQTNQEYINKVSAPTVPAKPAIEIILMTMVNEKQPLALRTAALYCLQCFFFRNEFIQAQLVQTLLPSNSQTSNLALGQLICGGLFSQDALSNWLTAVALSHCLVHNKAQKEQLLRVQLSIEPDRPHVSLLAQICSLLHAATKFQTRLGFLILLCHWLSETPLVVSNFLSDPVNVPYVGLLEGDEEDILVQGLCAFLLAICVEFNDNSVPNATREDLVGLIRKRIGTDTFLDRMALVAKQESYARSSQKPQLQIASIKEVVFDFEFCHLFKDLEARLVKLVQLHVSDEAAGSQAAISMTDEQHRILDRYKELIREQDMKLNELRQANCQLEEGERRHSAEMEELRITVQQLRDQNALLRANSNGMAVSGDSNYCAQQADSSAISIPIAIADASTPHPSHEELLSQLAAKDETISALQSQLQSYYDYCQALSAHQKSLESERNMNGTSSLASETETSQLRDELTRVSAERDALEQKANSLEAKLSQLAGARPHPEQMYENYYTNGANYLSQPDSYHHHVTSPISERDTLLVTQPSHENNFSADISHLRLDEPSKDDQHGTLWTSPQLHQQ